MSDTVQPHPPWRHAMAELLKDGLAYGQVIPHGRFWNLFGLQEPTDTTLVGIADKARLLHLQQMNPLKEHLLKEHQMALRPVPGHGYEVVAPSEQSKWADSEGSSDLRKAIRRWAGRLSNVNLAILGSRERQENADSLVRLASLRSFSKRALRRLSSSSDDTE